MLVAVGLLAVPGASLAGPPAHSNAGGNGKAEKSSEESAPAPEETAPADDGSGDGGGSTDGAGDTGSGDQGSDGAGGAPAEKGTSGDESSSEEGTTAEGEDASPEARESSKKEKSATQKSEDKTKPPGNNGTVKVDGVEFDDHPNNEPHVGCTFQIDFYGYDEGEDLFASATFVLQPPTTSPTGDDVLLHDEDIFIGEDEAGGGTDLDASRTYNLEDALEASGATPHPIQGYHIKLTVHAEGSIGADVKHKVFWVKCGEVGAQQIEVTKVWLEEGEEVPPPDDLKGSFRLVIEGQGENTGTLVCRVDDENNVDCEGDLVINDPDEPLKVTELNAPEGWEGPDEAFATCAEEDEEGACIAWEISIENVFVGGQQVRREFQVTKIWVGEGGQATTTPPPGIPDDLEIILEDEEGNQLVCSYQGSPPKLRCKGTLEVDTGDTVTVTEEPPIEGWSGDDEATAVCTEETKGNVTTRTCSFTVRNILEVLGGREVKSIEKIWLDAEGNAVQPSAAQLANFVLILEDPDEGGRAECRYQGTTLVCQPNTLQLEHGEILLVDEEGVPAGWDGPGTVQVTCTTIQDEGGTLTECTVSVVNEFAGGGRPPVILPGGPVTPPTLAVTGIEAEALLALAMILMGSGAMVLAGERRKRRMAG